MPGKYDGTFSIVLFISMFLISTILTENPDCSSQMECEKDIRVSCVAPETACCSGLQTGTDYRGDVFVFRRGSCSCCSRCEILQEEPPMMITAASGNNLRNGRRIYMYSTTVGDRSSSFKTLTSKMLTLSNVGV